MKKIFLFLILLLCLFLIACGGGGGSDNPSGGGNGGNGGGNGGGNSAPAHPWLCFTALTAGSSISTTNQGGTVTNTPSLEYSYDGKNWEPFTLNTGYDATNTRVPLANAGDKVYLRATGTNDSFSESGKYIKFKMEGSIAASGNIMSLLDKDCRTLSVPDNAFQYLFYNNTTLTTAPLLPATTLSYCCYAEMFNGCSSLTTAPDLPATTLADYCYFHMFKDCSSLTAVPTELPAINLATRCYEGMFKDCSAMATAPVLPATTLAEACYISMFYGCSALTTAPDLPATTLANSCYAFMFLDCSSLSSITVNFDSWDDAYTADWVNGVPNYIGTFTCPAGLTTDYGENRIPIEWSVQHLTP